MRLFARSSPSMDGRRNRWDRGEENIGERRNERRLLSSQMLPESNSRQADYERAYSISFSSFFLCLSVRVLDPGKCENEWLCTMPAKKRRIDE